MDTKISQDASNSKSPLNSRKASNSRIASNSMFERYSRNPNNTLATPGTSAKAERLATGNHQELKECQQQHPSTVWMQATAVTQATTVIPATSNSNIMTAHNSRKASNSRNESNKRTANIVWTPPKAGFLQKQ
jgi:hypothetical protein